MSNFELLKKICPRCFVAVLDPHPEIHTYEKCGLCGYCEKVDLKKREAIKERQKDHEYKRDDI